MRTDGPHQRADESTHLLPHKSYDSAADITNDEIAAYVLNRRTSIVLLGDGRLPTAFAANPNIPQQLIRTKSPTSGPTHGSDNISEIISTHSVGAEPETTIKTEVIAVLRYSIPLIATFLLKYSFTVASVFSVGRLGSKELAAVSLSSMTANISGYAIIQGVSTCLDTLCAQAYGRKEYMMVGVHFIRCAYLLLLMFIPMLILWVWGSEPILTAIVGDDQKELCQLAAKYLKVLLPGIPGYVLFECATHFLQCQGIFHALTYVLFVCAPLNAILNYLLVWDSRLGMGFVGAPLSVTIADWVMCIMIYGYIFFVKGHECLPRKSLLDPIYFRHWNKMLDLSIPGVLMVEAEWLAFEILTFTASKFGTTVLAAQSILTTTTGLLYQVPMALSITTSTRVAWFIGAASKSSAIIAASALIRTSVVLGLLNGLFIMIFRHSLALLYTNDEKVITLAAQVLIVAAIYQVWDFVTCSTAGVLRGQGRQKIGGYLNLFCYYLIALPFAFAMAFYFKFELLGLWFGMITALVMISCLQYFFVATSDWNYIINQLVNEAILDENNIS